MPFNESPNPLFYLRSRNFYLNDITSQSPAPYNADSYAADGNGYSSNVINWNSAVAFQSNNEFTPGTNYYTITTGYSGMFAALFKEIVALASDKGIDFKFTPNTLLQSIFAEKGVIHYRLARRAEPWRVSQNQTTQAAWLAMPR